MADETFHCKANKPLAFPLNLNFQNVPQFLPWRSGLKREWPSEKIAVLGKASYRNLAKNFQFSLQPVEYTQAQFTLLMDFLTIVISSLEMTSCEAQVYFFPFCLRCVCSHKNNSQLADSSRSQPGENKKGAKTVGGIKATF